jgi:hypothetical protein
VAYPDFIVHAQTVGASLPGAVSDSAGATLPHATVTILNVATGASRGSQTDDGGRYTAPPFRPATTKSTSRRLPQPFARGGLRLAVGQDAVLDVRLELGTVAEE